MVILTKKLTKYKSLIPVHRALLADQLHHQPYYEIAAALPEVNQSYGTLPNQNNLLLGVFIVKSNRLKEVVQSTDYTIGRDRFNNFL